MKRVAAAAATGAAAPAIAAASATAVRAVPLPSRAPLSFVGTMPVRHSSSYAASRLARLQSDADASPHDPLRQQRYLKALLSAQPAAVLARVQSGQFATNTAIQQICDDARRAMRAGTGDVTHGAYASYQQPQQQQQPHAQPYAAYAGAAASTPSGAALPAGLGSPSNPLIVADAPYSRIPWWESFTHALARAGVTLGVLGALYSIWVYAGKPNILAAMGDMSNKKDFLSRTMSTVRFADVKGCDEAKAELQEVVEYLKNPAKFERLGGRMTKGLLLTGPPGTGKTLLAKAVAGEAGVPFYAASGSEFDEMFVGVGASRVRELFAAARKQKRAIIFIDEIDAVGGSRDRIAGTTGRATINALLTEMDGFAENSGIVVIGATNHSEGLDAALVRPGRFDRIVPVALPDAQGRFEILQHYASKLKMAAGVDLRLLSQTTSGMTGADLSNMLNSAATRASAHGKTEVTHDEIEYAYDRVLMGAERQFTQSPEVKASTAYHEAGHTIMLLHTPGANELHKVTILPRGRALGVMFSLPYNEKGILTRKQLRARLDIAMGGRVAEELLHGKESITSGASSDLENASSIARQMVMQFGMGERTGVFTMPRQKESNVHPAQMLAPDTLQQMDAEVAQLLKDSYARALHVLTTHKDEWERLAKALIEHEVLDAKQVRQAVSGQAVTKKQVHKFQAQPKAGSPPAPTPPAPQAGGTGGATKPLAKKPNEA